MRTGPRGLPPSRRDKKQVIAHLDPVLVEAVHLRRQERGVTVQEILAEAVNAALAEHGRPPMLKVGRERVVRRRRALAKVQERRASNGSRAGKRRVAAWFDEADVTRVVAFSKEVGTRVEILVEAGLRRVLGESEIGRAKASWDAGEERPEAA